ncbi:Origin recognition complex, subunit 2 [Ostreococcus tauri]|uniref:Origin recognition complex subunit 2 n=1 Tax=Ostreococcus tauri TaxID=70448 RepID=A0A096PB20_OSTTA|nr:Origin recognition complex, subunit 2 [Ostreococcus tauri]CEG01875.1 Origin recognition complex, subunit 2 [Ostreococcus tauri]|eukprot:XP_022841220.1 Origin recognition complex, subunit 2 [Ostreococcus tauri]
MAPKRRREPAMPSFAATTGRRIARGGTRRVAGHKPLSREYVEARRASRAGRTRDVVEGDATGARGRGNGGEATTSGVASRDETLALAIADCLVAAERGEGALATLEADAEANGRDGRGKRRKGNDAHKGVGYIASKGRGRQTAGNRANLLGTLDLADEETVRELLGHLPQGHQNERAAIVKNLEKQHRRWYQLLRAGFNVLLYGFGSKKALMEDFETRYFRDGGVVIVNGFFPALTPKQVVVAAAAALTPVSEIMNDTQSNGSIISDKTPTETLLAKIQSATRGSATREPKRLYIVLHNIDGPTLRTSEAQALLGELASMDRVHLIASIDHVNAPLLWSKREAARFNWVWQEASTFASYALETANFPQLLASKGEERHVRGAANVLRSLTANGRAIFRLLAEHQLENEDSPGMPFDVFYASCREQFLVSSEVTLRVHLTEFTDHELVRSKRAHDGRDLLSIPLCADALRELARAFDAP